MAMTINTNIVSINAQRNLGLSGNTLGTTMQRLSSGLRVNSAKDDAAGLAIAERMNAQSKGLAVAARNANDGISLAQTAEGALGKVGDMLQRMRELAVQSSNATNSADDRKALQAEVNQLRSEIDRVAKTTTFNNQKILDGSFSGGVFQVGAGAGDNITVGAITNAKASNLSNVTYGASTSDVVQASDVTGYATKIDAGSLKIRVGSSPAVDLGEIAEANSGQERMGQVVAAINAKTADTGVTAFLEGDLSAGYKLQLRSSSGDAVSLQGFNTAQTGFGADVKSSTLEAAADVYDAAETALSGAASVLVATGGGYETNAGLEAVSAALATNASAKAAWDAGLADLKSVITANTNTSGAFVEGGQAKVEAAMKDLQSVLDKSMLDEGKTVRDSVYAKLDEMLAASPADFNSKLTALNDELTKLGSPANAALTAQTITASSSPEAVAAARNDILSKVDALMSGNVGIQAAEVKANVGIENLDISTQAGAWEALSSIDNAIDQVNAARATLGALQTRFEKTIENIDIMNENISAARGRIVDADFASETANLSRAQILQQAGTAMVAQANQLPQQVLSLLQ